MKVFTYNKAVAMRGRPKFSSPLKRVIYRPEQGKDKAFLLSEKGRIYLVEGEGVVDFPADQIEQAAFEKYAAMRGMRLWLILSVSRVRRCFDGAVLECCCDLYDYHQKAIVRGRKLRVMKVYKNSNVLFRALESFESLSTARLTISKDHQKLADEAAYNEMHSMVAERMLMSVMSSIIGTCVMALFFFFGLGFAIGGVVKFSEIVRSPYETKRKSAYACVILILSAIYSLAGIIYTLLR